MANQSTRSKPSRLYDFDHTIYAGDSSLDFYKFCLLRKPSILKYLPYQILSLILFKLGYQSRTIFKQKFFVFLRDIKNVDSYVRSFWEGHYVRIKRWYEPKDHTQDVIVSASPDFLLRPAFERLGAHTLVATNMDKFTGQIEGENCHGEEKVRRIINEIGLSTFEEAYSDHVFDAPMLGLAKKQYEVKGDKVKLSTER